MKAFFLIAGIVLLALVVFTGGAKSQSMVAAIGLVLASCLCFISTAIIEAGAANPSMKMQAALFTLGLILLVISVVGYYEKKGGATPLVLALPGSSMFVGAALIEVAIHRKTSE